jgi:uncharacterized protein (DUF2225 family)
MYLAQIAVKCPRCGSKFNSKQLPAWVDLGIRNSELRQDFAGKAVQAEPYSVCTCPACGRSDWMARFPATEEEAVLNQSALTPHLQFRNAAMQTEQFSKDFYDVGYLYLYAAWCADDARAYVQASEYRMRAIEAFSKSLNDVSCPVKERPTIEYLIGELYRRVGDFPSAQSHMQEILPRLPGKLAYMARKIMKLANEGNSDIDNFESPI